MHRYGPVFAAGVLCAACAGAQTYDGSPLDTSKCEIVSGQTEIEGTLQPFVGRACRQPNGVWVFVSEYGSGVAPDYGYSYYPYSYYSYPWWWGPPVWFGSTVVFVDHFHHFHRFHHFDHFRDFDHFHRFDHFHDMGRMPTAGHPPGMHSWGGGRGWAGGMRRN